MPSYGPMVSLLNTVSTRQHALTAATAVPHGFTMLSMVVYQADGRAPDAHRETSGTEDDWVLTAPVGQPCSSPLLSQGRGNRC